MEFVVKLTGDQTGLKDTVRRMVEDFQRTNVSMPVSWQPHQAAMSRYGNILSAPNATGGLEKFTSALSEISPGLGNLAGRLVGLAGPIGLVTTAVGGFVLAAKSVIGQLNEAAALARAARITGASAGMLDEFNLAASKSGMEPNAAISAISRLNSQVGAFNAGDQGAQKLFGELGINPSGMSVDKLLVELKGKFAGMNDPAARARAAKGLFGRGGFEMSELLTELNPARAGSLDSDDIETLGAARQGVRRWWENFKDGVSDQFREVIALAATGLGLARRRTGDSQIAGDEFTEPAAAAAAREFSKVPNLTTVKMPRRKGEKSDALSFAADSLAQAGLFAGSSLLYNPTFNIEQQQLNVLENINKNTARIGPGTFG
jgi:hypothetical protein